MPLTVPSSNISVGVREGDSGQSGGGCFGSALTEAGLHEVAHRAHVVGFTLWDTALVYGMGQSEKVLGKVLSRLERGEYQLSTKFTPQIAGDGTNRWPARWRRAWRTCARTTSAGTSLAREDVRMFVWWLREDVERVTDLEHAFGYTT